MFGIEKDAENFFEIQHKKRKFTHRKESNIFLSFLDILIKNEKNCFPTSVYWKKTSIGLLHSLIVSLQWVIKLALQDVLYIIFNKELKNIKIMQQKNMYPKNVMDNQTKTYVDKKVTVDSDTMFGKQNSIIL